jgi:flagellin
MNADMLQTSMGRLSSGLRINKAGDDPAGLIASENFRSQIGGNEAAMRNNQDAINFSKTAESTLNEVNQLLNDARGLVIASGNTATLTSTQLQVIQDQLASIASSISRISRDAQYGSKRLLDGSSGIQAQVSAGTEIQGISVAGMFKGVPITAQALMTVNSLVPGTQAALSSGVLAGGVVNNAGSFGINGSTFTFIAGTTGTQVAAAVNAASSSTGVTAAWNAGTNQLDFATTSFGQNAVLSFSDSSGVISAGPPTTVTGTNPIATISLGAMGTALFTGGRAGTDGLSLFDQDGNMVRLTAAGNASGGYPMTIGQIIPGSAVFQYGGNAGQSVQLALPNMSAAQLGNDVVPLMSLANLDITIPGNIANALLVVDRAISQVSSTRAHIGTFTSYVLESIGRSRQPKRT